MSETQYQENLHFITSHPEAVARHVTAQDEQIATLRAEVERLKSDRWLGQHGLIPSDYAHAMDCLRAEVERLKAVLISARDFADSELRNTALLMSNPPQSSAAWNVRNHIDAALGEEKKG